MIRAAVAGQSVQITSRPGGVKAVVVIACLMQRNAKAGGFDEWPPVQAAAVLIDLEVSITK